VRRTPFIVPAAVNTWSTNDIRRLRELAAAGLHVKQISLALNRTESAVRNKAALHYISLGIARRKPADSRADPAGAAPIAAAHEDL
jgi:hypothetical protein